MVHLTFPQMLPKSDLIFNVLANKWVWVIEPYQLGKMAAISVRVDTSVNDPLIKIDYESEARNDNELLITGTLLSKVLRSIKVPMATFFISDDMLVDVKIGSRMISPGLLKDVFSYCVNTQRLVSKKCLMNWDIIPKDHFIKPVVFTTVGVSGEIVPAYVRT